MLCIVAVMSCVVGLARGQLPSAPPHVPDACSDLNKLFDMLGSLQAECCPTAAVGCDAGAPTTCSTRCAAAVIPMVDRCGLVLSKYLPVDDLGSLTDLRDRCMINVTRVEVLGELKQRVQAGVCSGADLEGVAATSVSANQCMDAV